jgi:hypothetical protein
MMWPFASLAAGRDFKRVLELVFSTHVALVTVIFCAPEGHKRCPHTIGQRDIHF